jgi:hypothetical protein
MYYLFFHDVGFDTINGSETWYLVPLEGWENVSFNNTACSQMDLKEAC